MRRTTVTATMAGALVALAVMGSFMALDRTVLHWYAEATGGSEGDLIEGISGAEAPTAFTSDEVLSLTEWHAARNVQFPENTYWVECVEASYRSQNHRWLVTCDYKYREDTPVARTEMYVFDDETGRVVD